MLFGRFEADVLDDDELDTMILMPAIVIACGLRADRAVPARLRHTRLSGPGRLGHSAAPHRAVPGQQHLRVERLPASGGCAGSRRHRG